MKKKPSRSPKKHRRTKSLTLAFEALRNEPVEPIGYLCIRTFRLKPGQEIEWRPFATGRYCDYVDSDVILRVRRRSRGFRVLISIDGGKTWVSRKNMGEYLSNADKYILGYYFQPLLERPQRAAA